jgi:hypothetical protein
MIPGMLIRVNPYKYMTAYCNLWTQEEYHRVIQAGIIKQNMISLEPGMICLVLEKVVWGRETYCKILVGDQVYYMHHSLYNQTNFQVVRAEAA